MCAIRLRTRTLSASRSNWSPGVTGRRSLTRSRESSTASFPVCSSFCPISTPDNWAIASTMSTPGMIGVPG